MTHVLVKGDNYCEGCAHQGDGRACLEETLPCWATGNLRTGKGYLIIKIREVV